MQPERLDKGATLCEARTTEDTSKAAKEQPAAPPVNLGFKPRRACDECQVDAMADDDPCVCYWWTICTFTTSKGVYCHHKTCRGHHKRPVEW